MINVDYFYKKNFVRNLLLDYLVLFSLGLFMRFLRIFLIVRGYMMMLMRFKKEEGILEVLKFFGVF